MSFDFKLPDLGEGIREAEVLAVKVAEGQAISEDQILFEVETDKAVVEIPSPVAGKALRVLVKPGQIVVVGNVMISIEESGQTQIATPENISANVERRTNKQSTDKEANPTPHNGQAIAEAPIIATPATRQLAREMKIDLHKVPATGPGGKISKEDVLAYAESSNKQVPAIPGIAHSAAVANTLPDFAKFGEIERVPMRSLRRKTAQLMALSWSRRPHVTHCDEANITELEIFRNRVQYQDQVKKQGAKLTLTVFIMKAVALALQEFPEFNTSFDEQSDEIIFKRYYNLGMAVATERGLIVPVIKSVDKKNIFELAVEISEVAEKARAAKSELSELQGATFTVTNIGAIGGISATPIIHYPEAAILAVMKTTERAINKNGNLENVLIVPLCLAFDHRLADGAQAAKFTRAIIKMLENPRSFEKHLGA